MEIGMRARERNINIRVEFFSFSFFFFFWVNRMIVASLLHFRKVQR